MATTKVKRSVHKKQSAKTIPTNKKRRTQNRSSAAPKPAPGQLALLEKSLPHRRFVEFPLVKGKTTEKVQLFLALDCNSLTIEFQDKTALNLDLVPGLTINAEFQQHGKDDIHVLAEWPPIRSEI